MKRKNMNRLFAGFLALALMLSTFVNDYNTIAAHAEDETTTEEAASAPAEEAAPVEAAATPEAEPASEEPQAEAPAQGEAPAAVEAVDEALSTDTALTADAAAAASEEAAVAATSEEAAAAASSIAAAPVAQTYTISYKVNDPAFGSVSIADEKYDPSSPNISGADATPADGYRLVNWTTDDGNGGQKEVGTDSHFKPENVTGDITYTANFEAVTATTEEAPVTKTVNITYAAGDGGTVSRTEESLDVNSKDSKVEGSTATANDGYEFANWTDASGAEVSTDPTFAPSKDSLTNDSYSYTAHFNKKAKEVKEITISYTAGEGGKVDPSSQKIDLNDEAAKVEGSTATADEGYDFVNWTNADGKEVSTDKTFAPAKGDLSADVTYTANFKKAVEEKNVTVTYKAGEGGKVSVKTETVDLNKEDAAFKGATATADDGYQFVKWTGAEDATVSEEATFVPAVKDVTADVTYTAVFEKKANNAVITYKSTNGGNVYPSTEAVDLNDKDAVAKGSKATLVSKLFEFVNWTDEDGNEVSTDLTFVPEKVTGNATYTANFKNLVEMPRQVFHGSANGVNVSVVAEEKTFPADTTMKVTAASVDEAVAADAVDGDVVDAKAVDITFYDKDGNKIEPSNENSVHVTMTLDEALDGEDHSVVHVTGDSAEKVADAGASGASFEANSFSVYIILGVESRNNATNEYTLAVGDEPINIEATSGTGDHWSSSDPSVAKVEYTDDSQGNTNLKLSCALVTPVAEGDAIIRFNNRKQVTIHVTKKLSPTVSFNLNGGTGTVPDSISTTGGKIIDLPLGEDITKTGYTLLGWSIYSDASWIIQNSKYTIYSLGGKYKVPYGDKILYAVWARNQDKGYSGRITIAVRTDGVAPSEPAVQFDGKYVELEHAASTDLSSYFKLVESMAGVSTVEGNLTDAFNQHVDSLLLDANIIYNIRRYLPDYNTSDYYIDWYVIKHQSNEDVWHVDGVLRKRQNTINVEYKPNCTDYAGNFPNNKNYTLEGSSITIEIAGEPTVIAEGHSPFMTRTGYTFGGWTLNQDGSGTVYKYGDELTISNSTILYAKWIPDQLNVTYSWSGYEGTAPTGLPAKATVNYGDSYTPDATHTSTTTFANEYGTWTFSGWSKTAAFEVTADTKIEGTWKLTKPATKTVTYSWSGYEGTAPTGLPAKATVNYGDSYTPDATHTSTTTFANEYGIWTFSGWSKTAAFEVTADTKIEGTWKLTKPATKTVTYSWSGYEGTAPTGLPAKATVNYGDSYTPDATHTSTTTFANEYGTWTFSGWSKTAAFEVTADTKIEGTWKLTKPATKTVTYSWSGYEGTAPTGLPAKATVNYGDSYTPDATHTSTTTFANEYGTWTFSGWSKTAAFEVTADTKIEGTWKLTKPATKTVTYSWSGYEGTAPTGLPAKATVNYGDSYTPDATHTSTTTFANEYGTWTFSGWSKTAAFEVTADTTINGTWKLTKPATKTVTYSWSGYEGTAPTGLPAKATVNYGDSYTPDATHTSTTTFANEYGTWTFSGWSKTAAFEVTADTTIEGTWKLTKPATKTVTYSWSGYEGTAPTGLPAKATVNYGDSYTPDATHTSTTTFANEYGTWTFSGWSKTAAFEVTADTKIEGTWKLTKPATKTVTYSWSGYEGTAPTGLPAKATVNYGDSYTPDATHTSTTTFANEYGTWTFSGWSKTAAFEVTADTTIEGTWKLTKPATKTVTYSWSGYEGTAPTGLPAKATVNYGDSYTPDATHTSTTTFANEYGTWTFSGWSKTAAFEVTADTKIEGTWKLTKPATKTVTYSWSGYEGTAPTGLPAKATVNYGDSYTPDATHTSTTTFANEYGTWTFSGWSKTAAFEVTADTTINGTWKLTKPATKTVTYSWSGYEGTAPTGLPAKATVNYGDSYTPDATHTSTTTFANEYGTWTFSGWSKTAAFEVTADTTIEGTWKLTKPATKTVTYSWSGYEGTAPTGLPAKATVNYGDSYTPDATHTSTTTFANEYGTWTFSGWSKTAAFEVTADTKIEGTWKLTKPATKTVTYSWSGYEGTAPTGLPAKATVNYGDSYTPDATHTSTTTFANEYGTWTFSGWSKTAAFEVTADTKIEGTWKLTKPATKTVTYSWSGYEGTAPTGLPAKATVNYGDSYTPDATHTSTTTFANEYGTWTFSGWSKTAAFEVTADTKIEGTWKLTKPATKTVTYSWSGYEGTAPTGLPAKATVNYGDSYTPDATHTSTTTFANEYGTWTFSGWSKTAAFEVTADTTINGTWELTTPATKAVGYSWTGYKGTAPTGLPASATVSYGDSYTPDATFTKTSTYTNEFGIWTFSGWDKTAAFEVTADTTINGTWELTTPATKAVGYSWTGYKGTAPTGLPASATVSYGDSYTPDATFTKTSTYTNEFGIWTFSGWDKTAAFEVTADTTINGTWELTTPATKAVGYSWTGYKGTAPTGLPAKATVNYGDSYTPDATHTSTTTFANEYGIWTFSGWSKTAAFEVTADTTISGTWTLTTPITKTVTYAWSGVTGTQPTGLPASATVSYGDSYTPDTAHTSVTTFTNEYGEWTFSGWDKTAAFEVTADTTISGTWTLTTPTLYTYTVNYLNQTTGAAVAPQKSGAGQVLGTSVMETALSISGYTLASSNEHTITIKTEGNIITFYYTANGGGDDNNNGGGGGDTTDTVITPVTTPTNVGQVLGATRLPDVPAPVQETKVGSVLGAIRNVVQTGDDSMMVMWGTMFAAAVAVLAAWLKKRHQGSEN